MRTDLPTGTVTFLFTDIEGSTALLDELGAEAYEQALADHRRILRACCASEDGLEVDNQGDAFFFVFASAHGAVAAAECAQEALSTGPVRVRVGVHTGTALVGADGYVGLDVHRAARIGDAGHGGQVLISAATAGLVGKERLTDLGEHRLKDLAQPIRLYQLGTETFPRLRSLYNTNLPVAIGTFVGRQEELKQLIERLSAADGRLVTLTGPGGTGKTRLAQQAAAEVADLFSDGVWWVALAAVRDVSAVLPTIAQVLEVKAAPDEEAGEALLKWLRGKRPLLVMDNVEQLLPGVAAEVRRLLERSEIVLLVTSRERLQLQGETLFPIAGLAQVDAHELFVARATALNPAFADDGSVAGLCQLLDSLPLAIELAAARTLLFPPRLLLERVGERLDLFRAGRDADPRQQTLRTTIEWSYDLLDSDEARLFRELGVFVGGCSYGAAVAVAGADPDTLQSLIDKSLVRQRDSELGPRYSMLETVRQYAAERLAGADQAAVRDRHLHWVANETFANARRAREYDAQAMAFLRDEQPNIGVALTYAIESGAAEPAQQIVQGTWFYWANAGLVPEGDRWVTAVTDMPSLPTLDHARVLTLAASRRIEGARAEELRTSRSVRSIGRLDHGGHAHGYDRPVVRNGRARACTGPRDGGD